MTLWGVSLLSAWNAGRALALSRQLPIIQPLPTTTDPLLWLVNGAVWAAAFAAAAVALWRKRPFIRLGLPLLIALHALTEIGFVLQTTAVAPVTARVVSLLVVYGALVLLSIWALNRQDVHWYFTQSAKKEEADHGR